MPSRSLAAFKLASFALEFRQLAGLGDLMVGAHGLLAIFTRRAFFSRA
jgi:hypothetical protein